MRASFLPSQRAPAPRRSVPRVLPLHNLRRPPRQSPRHAPLASSLVHAAEPPPAPRTHPPSGKVPAARLPRPASPTPVLAECPYPPVYPIFRVSAPSTRPAASYLDRCTICAPIANRHPSPAVDHHRLNPRPIRQLFSLPPNIRQQPVVHGQICRRNIFHCIFSAQDRRNLVPIALVVSEREPGGHALIHQRDHQPVVGIVARVDSRREG